MKVGNSSRTEIQTVQESSISSQEKAAAQTTVQSQSTDTIENAADSMNTFDIAKATAGELSVVRQLAILGIDHPTKEQVAADVKMATDPELQKERATAISFSAQRQVWGAADERDGYLDEITDKIAKIRGDKNNIWTPLDAINDLLKTPTFPSQPSGSYATGNCY